MTDKGVELQVFGSGGQSGTMQAPAVFAEAPNAHAVYLASVRQSENKITESKIIEHEVSQMVKQSGRTFLQK